jgi:arsenite methyltransferase
MDSQEITSTVHKHYSTLANTPSSTNYSEAVASAFGYSSAELASIPAASNLGLSCGNPVAIAKLKQGETVVDLGCGAGIDVFLAAAKVGETGRAIGVDFSEVGEATPSTWKRKSSQVGI